MKKFILWYYLLFMLLIMGTFASMAQNEYGNILLAWVAFAFAFLFMLQFVSSFSSALPDRVAQAELLSLSVLAAVLGLRIFYIRFPGVEVVYGFAGVLLMAVHFQRMVSRRMLYIQQNKVLTWLVVVFHLSVIVYVFSMTVVPFAPALSTPAGEIAFVFLMLFLLFSFLNTRLIVEGETVSAWRVISRWQDHSLLIIGLFVLFTAYLGMTRFDAMPRMHSDELPNAYSDLLRQKDGKEAGLQKAEAFKNAYDLFVTHEDAREKQ